MPEGFVRSVGGDPVEINGGVKVVSDRIRGGEASVRVRFRSSKYGAQRTTIDGIAFASKREASRYQELKLMQMAGEIQDLELQPDRKSVV